LGTPYAGALSGLSDQAQASAATTTQSDPTAIQAIRNVIAQSGGTAAWGGIRSAEEKFSVSVTRLGTTSSKTMLLLNDWSTGATRYRTSVQGERNSQPVHDGAPKFTMTNMEGRTVDLPELDQARMLIGRLPAAAADVMLRRPEYVLKISKMQRCDGGSICVDIFRNSGSGTPVIPEQEWKISSATGLPVSVRGQVINALADGRLLWKEIRFVQYGVQEGLTIPTKIEVSPAAGLEETWIFVTLKLNPGFDPALLDQEAMQ
jgi:hypothetical protein